MTGVGLALTAHAASVHSARQHYNKIFFIISFASSFFYNCILMLDTMWIEIMTANLRKLFVNYFIYQEESNKGNLFHEKCGKEKIQL